MVAVVSLARPWFYGGKLYDTLHVGVEIPGLEEEAAAQKKKVEELLPKGAKLVTGPVTPLPITHPTVTTLSELAKVPAQDAVSASKGPTVVISDEAAKGNVEAAEKAAAKK